MAMTLIVHRDSGDVEVTLESATARTPDGETVHLLYADLERSEPASEALEEARANVADLRSIMRQVIGMLSTQLGDGES